MLNVLDDGRGDDDADAEDDRSAKNSDGHVLVLAHFLLEIKWREQVKEFESDESENDSNQSKDDGREDSHSK